MKLDCWCCDCSYKYDCKHKHTQDVSIFVCVVCVHSAYVLAVNMTEYISPRYTPPLSSSFTAATDAFSRCCHHPKTISIFFFRHHYRRLLRYVSSSSALGLVVSNLSL